jgi:hypothetical protein
MSIPTISYSMQISSNLGTVRVLIAGEQALGAASNIHFLQALSGVPNLNTE